MLQTISPVDDSVYAQRPLASNSQIEATLDRARTALRAWRATSIADRAAVLSKFCDVFESRRDEIAPELTWQMGRPIRYTPNEVRGTLERARYMISIAPAALADI